MRRSAYLLAAVALVFRNDLVHGGDGVLGCVLIIHNGVFPLVRPGLLAGEAVKVLLYQG